MMRVADAALEQSGSRPQGAIPELEARIRDAVELVDR